VGRKRNRFRGISKTFSVKAEKPKNKRQSGGGGGGVVGLGGGLVVLVGGGVGGGCGGGGVGGGGVWGVVGSLESCVKSQRQIHS